MVMLLRSPLALQLSHMPIKTDSRASDIKVDIHWAVDLYYPAWEKKHVLFWDGLHLNSKVSTG